MEKEKGIDREEMIATISALVTAAQKSINAGQELRVEINPRAAQSAQVLLEVVVQFPTPSARFMLKAGDYIDNPRLGQLSEARLTLSTRKNWCTTAKQSIMQRIRLHEKDVSTKIIKTRSAKWFHRTST